MQAVLFTALILLNGFLILGWMIAVLLPIVGIGLIFVINLFPFVFGSIKHGHDVRAVVDDVKEVSQRGHDLLPVQDAYFFCAGRKTQTYAERKMQTLKAFPKTDGGTSGHEKLTVVVGGTLKKNFRDSALDYVARLDG